MTIKSEREAYLAMLEAMQYLEDETCIGISADVWQALVEELTQLLTEE